MQPGAAPPDNYLSKLVKMIPGEAQSLFVLGGQVIGADPGNTPYLRVWQLGFCGLVVVVVRWFGTREKATPAKPEQGIPAKPKVPPDYVHIILSLIAYYVWVYAASDAFRDWPNAQVYKFLPTLLVLIATFAIPYFYKGDES